MNARILRGLAAAAVAVAVSSPGPALAGQDTVPPGTLTLGPVRITPGVTLTDMGFDDNVFNEPDDPKRDFTFTLTPRANVLFRMRRLTLNYLGATDYVYFNKYSSERGTNTSSVGRVEFDLGRLKPYGTIQGVNTKTRLNSEVDARARHRDLTYGAGVAFRFASRTSVVVNGTQKKIGYEPDEEFRGVDLEQSFNGRRRAIDAGLAFALTPLTTLTMVVEHEQQRFQLSPDRNSNAWRVSPTFTFSPTGVLTGSASVGYRRFEPVSPTLPAYTGLVSVVNISATIYGRHQVQGQFSRDVQYSYDLDNDYYIGTGGTMSWTWLLFGPIDVRATGGRYLMDYRGGPLESSDMSSTYGGGVGYRFGNRARLGANIVISRRDSKNSSDRDFRNQRLFVGLTWGIT
jgi:hypothetical protein